MKPVYAKNDMVHFWVAASSAAWGWRNSKSGATIPKSFGFEAATHYGTTNRCHTESDLSEPFSKNSRPGVAILVVLFVIMVATIISLSFIARSDVELAFGNNIALRMQMDYLAESGLTHAKALIRNPQDIETDPNVFWSGVEDFSLKDLDFYGLLETGDYYDVVVARDDSDPTDRCNYDISCLAYRLDGGAETAQSYLNARLRLDPCIAYWAGADTPVSIRTTVNGDVYCSGSLTNLGTINGDVHALGLAGTGTVAGRWYDIGVTPLDVTWPEFRTEDFTPNYYIDSVAYTPPVLDANDVLMNISFVPNSGNPAGVIVCIGNLTLMGNVVIDGTLIVGGDVTILGANNVITPVKNFPAIVVDDSSGGNLTIEANGQLTAGGLVQTETITVRDDASDVVILGALFVDDDGIDVDPGYTGNITITAAPMIASTKVSPDGSTTVRWTPIGGAFFKWIKRE